MNIIEFDEECKSCEGTGLYMGLAERNGAAIVCSDCEGTGRCHVKIEYETFTQRKKRTSAKRVYQTNPGIVIGEGKGLSLEDFGGMPLSDWEEGKPFPPKSENRKYTCPRWWYQSANYKKQPKWEECYSSMGTVFSKCKHFPDRESCWERWDEMQERRRV